jgi:membrane protein required for colicin V production
MNALDWVLLALLGFAAVRGFFHGFVVEIASLVAVILGIWTAARYNARVAAWIGLDAHHEVISFIITFIGVLILVHLLAKAVTKAMDMAMLGLPNKVAGTLFGALRAAFILSVALNILMARAEVSGIVTQQTLDASKLYRPLRALAPFIIPALGDSRWVQEAIDVLRKREDRSSDNGAN